jgi:hypothetical protein
VHLTDPNCYYWSHWFYNAKIDTAYLFDDNKKIYKNNSTNITHELHITEMALNKIKKNSQRVYEFYDCNDQYSPILMKCLQLYLKEHHNFDVKIKAKVGSPESRIIFKNSADACFFHLKYAEFIA